MPGVFDGLSLETTGDTAAWMKVQQRLLVSSHWLLYNDIRTDGNNDPKHGIES